MKEVHGLNGEVAHIPNILNGSNYATGAFYIVQWVEDMMDNYILCCTVGRGYDG